MREQRFAAGLSLRLHGTKYLPLGQAANDRSLLAALKRLALVLAARAGRAFAGQAFEALEFEL